MRKVCAAEDEITYQVLGWWPTREAIVGRHAKRREGILTIDDSKVVSLRANTDTIKENVPLVPGDLDRNDSRKDEAAL